MDIKMKPSGDGQQQTKRNSTSLPMMIMGIQRSRKSDNRTERGKKCELGTEPLKGGCRRAM